MTTEEIMNCIGKAGPWLPIIAVRSAFTNRDAMTPLPLAAAERQAAAATIAKPRAYGAGKLEVAASL